MAGDREACFQRAMAIVFRMPGLKPHVEMATSDGRIDMVVETPGPIYRFEMMRNRPSRGAMAQIEAKRHAARYARDGWGRVSNWARASPRERGASRSASCAPLAKMARMGVVDGPLQAMQA